MKKFFSIVAALMFVGSLVAAVYEKAAFADITASDEVIITTAVEDVYYALVNTEATSDKPNTEIVTVVSDAIETDVTNLQWNIVAIEDSLVLYPAGQTELRLAYHISSNNLRVNKNGQLFGFEFTADECLKAKNLEESKGLNLGLTNAKDKWGHYNKTTVITFFKKKSNTPDPPVTNIYTLTISSGEGGSVNESVNGKYDAGDRKSVV